MTSMVSMDSTLESLTPSVNALLQCYMQGLLGSCDLNSNQHPFCVTGAQQPDCEITF
jgi:hypothetical protein